MALGIRVEISTDGPADAEFAWWDKFAANPPSPEDIRYIRMPGVSASGPCALCAQYFGMEHDGSGREVPLIPQHANCCCIDAISQIANQTDNPPKPLRKGEWLETGPGREMQASILGKGKAALVRSGLAEISDLYKRKGPLSRPITLAKAAGKALRGATRAELARAATRAGVAVTRAMTRQELIDAITRGRAG